MHVLAGDTDKANESKQVSDTYATRLDIDRRNAHDSASHRLLQVLQFIILYERLLFLH